jgi:catechol 2,3-dioxygenase-like lactoylglutathione lyase family enzyme
VLHHVGIEIKPAGIERAVELFELLGFERVQPPPTLAEFTWLERAGTQIHLMPSEQPVAAPRGHLAVAVEDFDGTVARLAGAGFEVERRRAHWGAPRALVLGPDDQRVELMAAPPDPVVP